MDSDPVSTARYGRAAEFILTQAAHRLLAVAIWLLAARVALGFFDYDPKILSWILRGTMVALDSALVCAFASYWICRLTGLDSTQPRGLLLPTLCLIGLTALWMLVGILAARQAS